jgi:hypothetical protein
VFPVLILVSNSLDFEVSQQPSLAARLNLPFFGNKHPGRANPMITGPCICRPQRIATPRRPASVFQPQLVTLTQQASQQPHPRTHKASSRASQRPLQEKTIQSHIPVARPMVTPIYKEVRILTDVDILKAGLQYAGFDKGRQDKVNLNRNMMRYKQHYGVDPSTAAILFRDLRDKFQSFKYKDGLMTINWLFLNDKQSVLSGRWGYCEEYIGPTVKEYATMIQSLRSKKIKFVFRHDKRIKASIDCSSFTTNEFRQDPSGKWFDHKSNSCGLVCLFAQCVARNALPPTPSILTIVPASQQKYEACLDIYEGRLVWLRGPFEAGMHDMTIFRGGKEEDRKENWDHNALYFKVRQGDRIVGDSGYEGEPRKIVVMRDEHSKELKKFLARVCSRQETFFKGLKDWKILKFRFTYGSSTQDRMKLHKMAVEAIAVIRQYDYENGHPPFEVC